MKLLSKCAKGEKYRKIRDLIRGNIDMLNIAYVI